MFRSLVFLLLIPVAGAQAQNAIFKCVDDKGAIAYQNAPCPDDAKVEDIREYQPISRQEAIAAERDRQLRLAQSQQQRLHERGTVVHQNIVNNVGPTVVQRTRANCAAAKRDRDKARKNAPMWRHVHYLEPWEKRVREACKGMW